MNQPTAKQQQKKMGQYVSDNVLESVRGLGTSTAKAVQHDVVDKISDDMIRELFSAGKPTSELHQEESVQIPPKQEKPKITNRELMQPLVDAEAKKTKESLSLIREQLSTLAKQSKSTEVHKLTLENASDNQGIYHQNFLERLADGAKKLLTNPDDQLTWFKESGTKRKRMSFWGAYKKHGTSFGLSNERTVATQSG